MSKLSKNNGLIYKVNRDKIEKRMSEIIKIPSPWFKEEEITK